MDIAAGLRVARIALVCNALLAVVKIGVGLVGNSYALVADGIESTMDVVGSLVVWGGLRIAARPPDRDHPYGHGKAESLAGVFAALLLLGAAALIAVQSISEILTPHHAPESYTLAVLLGVVVIKEGLYRWAIRHGRELGSTALSGDAWHHRSDALSSLAAAIGISLALIGGPGWEPADDWAALAACAVIAFNALLLLRRALPEAMDAAAPGDIDAQVRAIADAVAGVHAVEKCRIRKSGLGYLMDIHIEVDGEATVRHGHDIAHRVKDALIASELPILDVTVHVEPDRR